VTAVNSILLFVEEGSPPLTNHTLSFSGRQKLHPEGPSGLLKHDPSV